MIALVWMIIQSADNKSIAYAYYTAMAEQNSIELAKYLDEKVIFVAPLATVVGKNLFFERV